MTLQLNGTNGLTFNDGSLQPSAASGKNLIINGDMAIDQRNAGASITPTNAQYTIDRFNGFASQASKYTVQQNAGAIASPSKFYYYLGATSSSAYSIVAADFFALNQAIEGFNALKLNWGRADAQTVTLSFWARSSLTGTFGGSLRNRVPNRSYPYTYTIDSANTWEYKTITIPGDTSGTWSGTNTVGIYVSFGLGVGSTFSGSAGSWAANNYISASGAVSVVGTSGATLYITGVQLETGTKATPFENLRYEQQLALCQRYFQTFSHAWVGVSGGAGYFQSTQGTFNTAMRTTPTATRTGGSSTTRYPSSSWAVYTKTAQRMVSRVAAASAGGNEGWTASGILEAEL
tara:strand:+ start:112 stop:1152 length:1041 start_codon:yes stop_codon:yes gene_type:complete